MTTKAEESNPRDTGPVPDVKAEKKHKADPKGVKLDLDLQKDVDRICAAEGISFGRLVQDAVRAHILNPARQRGLVLRSLAIARQEIEKAKAAGILPVEAVEDFLQQLQGILVGAQSPSTKTRKPSRGWGPPTILGLSGKRQ